jgi:hypothetical protein
MLQGMRRIMRERESGRGSSVGLGYFGEVMFEIIQCNNLTLNKMFYLRIRRRNF